MIPLQKAKLSLKRVCSYFFAAELIISLEYQKKIYNSIKVAKKR
ncbi:hypothetical protein SYNTR_0260 [Candidatus Syntrophocurvum alkaliphilum]|uniref:Uncharacterized protein n=1 Tax=Candidatus Syntrophocurvum alkaliphilum TaxID=2293317 RepID=A0A6I6D6K2_9FIRM|nr:hypothetical protein SYNTR_0260 [Candidatus Syntrophocurvum alkaliphilum]